MGAAAAVTACLLLFLAGCGHSGSEPASVEGAAPDAISAVSAARTGEAAPDWSSPLEPDELKRTLRLSPVPAFPIDPTNHVSGNEAAAELGRHLFHTRALSKADKISCATCHDARSSFADGKKLSEGVMQLERHAPSLWNVAHLRWFFWDGRSDSLWAQALVPLEDPLEHAFTRTGVARAVHSDPELRKLYVGVFGEMPPFDDESRFPPAARPVPVDDRAHQLAAAHAQRMRAKSAPTAGTQGASAPEHHTHLYGTGFYHPHQRAWDGMTPEDQELVTRAFVNVGKSIAAFQERMVSDASPFDVFVEGLREKDAAKTSALDPSAVRGLKLFVGKAQCIICHHGPLLTDYEFHDTQVPSEDSLVWAMTEDGELPAGGVPPADLGRVHGVERLRASEFGVGSSWSDDPDGPARVKVDYLPSHLHEGSPEFKTPSLRNVELTPPYMHNGAFDTLEEVIEFYSTRTGARSFGGQAERILQPLHLTAEESADLVAFLESLTDDSLDQSLVRAPR
jgi:cytochrome c peroxidase